VGVDVMNTNFCDFRKISFLLKPNVLTQILQKLGVFCTKTPIFIAKIFGGNIFKIKTIAPW
jgi:hypothetical protein